jgi:23S rRNA pseudouridine2605 synthase
MRVRKRASGLPASRDPPQRLQKALAQLGFGSRREVESWIRAGRLSVNGATAVLGMRVRHSDQIRLDGRLVRRRAPADAQVFVCHRSPGEPLSASAPDRVSLFERLPRTAGRRFIAVSPMPPHDGGLELLTSDGELAARLQRASRELTAEFSVRTHGQLTDTQLAGVQSGRLDQAQLEVISCSPSGGEGVSRWYSIVVRGARGKDVRQLFERSGVEVSRVLRTRLGPVALDRRLARGQFRRLGADELAALATKSHGPPGREQSLLSVEAPAADAPAGRAEQREIRAGQRLRKR